MKQLYPFFLSCKMLAISISLWTGLLCSHMGYGQSNVFSGSVFLDEDASGSLTNGDIKQWAVRVYLHEDQNANAVLDAGDLLLEQQYTDVNGDYAFTIPFKPQGAFSLNQVPLQEEDDSEEKIANGDIKTDDDEGNLGQKGGDLQWVGLRFQALNIPVGAVITNATLTFTAAGDESDPCNLRFYAEAIDDSPLFAQTDFDLSSRTRTTSMASWNTVPAWTPFPNPVGSGNGENGIQNFSDLDGLFSDPLSGILYATVRNVSNDYLIQIDPLTGQAVKNAFGPTIDYVVIKGTGILADVDDFAIDPTCGTLYAMNNTGIPTQLITIDKASGVGTVIGATGVQDIEGLSFTDDGDLYGVTGTGGTTRNSLVQINKSTGAATVLTAFRADSDFESCECRKGPPVNIVGLPVEYFYFEAQADEFQVQLEWATLSETDNAFFSIERSPDRIHFEKIGQMTARGAAAAYVYTDEAPFAGRSWYRLKQVDWNGNFSFSEIREVNLETPDLFGVSVYPNPVSANGLLHVQFQAPKGNTAEVELLNLQGKILQKASVEIGVSSGLSALSLDLQGRQPGIYFVRIRSGRVYESRKLVIRE